MGACGAGEVSGFVPVVVVTDVGGAAASFAEDLLCPMMMKNS